MPPQYLTWDGSTGTTRDYWNRGAKLAWKHQKVGDWRDAAGVAQGEVPFASAKWPADGAQTMDVTALVADQVAGDNRGFFLKATGTDYSITFGGRLSDRRPTLRVVTDVGAFDCPMLATAYWAIGSYGTYNGQQEFIVQKGQFHALIQFDYQGVTGTVQSAALTLTTTLWKRITTVLLFEADPPQYLYVPAPVGEGLAAQFPLDAGIASHPSVLFASDFTDMNAWDVRRKMQNAEVVVGANGLPEIRCKTPIGEQSGIGLTKFFMRGAPGVTGSEPDRVVDEAYFRYYLTLEDDWRSTVDANKTPGFDCRMGVWQATHYWYPTGGNGGSPNDGRHELWADGRHAYNGHMIRGHSGQQITDGNPYSELVWLGSYNYNIDQTDHYGDSERWSNVVIRRGDRVCIEKRIRMNSLTGEPDAAGNREAVADGILEVWVNGVLAHQALGVRWRRHPQIGVAAIDMSMYHGGKSPVLQDMHCRWGHVVVATEYIGPMRA